jgi:uncharacterized protein (DUF4415 family)
MVNRTKFVAGRGYSEADWREVSDNPALTGAELRSMKPFTEVFPQFAAAVKTRGKQKAPTKELVSLRLNRATLASFRALGPGWQNKIDEILAKAAQEF